MSYSHRSVLVVLLLVAATFRADEKSTYTIKLQEKQPAPKELRDDIRQLLVDRSVQLIDSNNEIILEFWPRNDLPAKATEAQIKNGITYRELAESTILGAVKIHKEATSYRKQKIPAGVYTLRLADQPQSDDHRGTAPSTDFVLLCPAAEDKSPELMEAKASMN